MKTLKEFALFLSEQTKGEFSLEKLKFCSTFREVLIYMENNFGSPDSEGSSRKTWFVTPKTVVKVVRVKSNVAQNIAEIRNIKCLGPKFAVNLIDYDRTNHFWILEEKLLPVSNSEYLAYFSKKLETRFDNYTDILILFLLMTQNRSEFPTHKVLMKKLLESNLWFQEFYKAVIECGVQSWDFKPNNWGKRESTGELVLLDLGF